MIFHPLLPADPLEVHGQYDRAAAVMAVSAELEKVRTVTPALKKDAKEQKSWSIQLSLQ